MLDTADVVREGCYHSLGYEKRQRVLTVAALNWAAEEARVL